MTSRSSGQDAATVILAIDVPPGSEVEYQEWQRRVNDAAAQFPGFVGAQVIEPTPDVQSHWTCLYRFRSAAELHAWLDSEVRAHFLTEVGDRFRDVRQRTLASDDADDGVTFVISHRVPKDRVGQFLALQAQADDAQSAFPGYRGTRLLRPVPGAQPEWTALVRFDNEDNLRAWVNSDQRAKLVNALGQMDTDFDTEVIGSSFGSWFSFSMRDGVATPNWKQWLTVLLVLYPVVMLLGLITPYLPGGLDSTSFPPARWFFLNMWVANLLSTLLLTFALMPLVTRALRWWLDPRASRKITVIGLGVVAGLFAASLIVFDRACSGGC